MSNRTVPATAEGLSKDSLSKLETLFDTARMSAHVANHLLAESLGGEAVGDTVRITEWKRELLIFATGRAAADAEEANAAFLDAVYMGSVR